MMAVVVDHGDAARFPASLESALDAGKELDRLADGFNRHLQLERHGDGGGRVQHIVNSRNLQVKFPQAAPARANGEVAFKRSAIGFDDMQSGLVAAAASNGPAIDGGEKLLHVFVLQAQPRGAIKANSFNKLEERRSDFADRRIVLQVLAVD